VIATVTAALAQSFSFVSMGDWGNPVHDRQRLVAAQMGTAIRSLNASFLIAAGDNFYEYGVTSDTDPQWQGSYRDIYSDPAFNLPWYVIAGNHDWRQDATPEVDYYKHHRDSRWIFPHFWYKQSITIPAGQTLDLVMIDTVLLCPFCTLRSLQKEIMSGESDPAVMHHFRQAMHRIQRLGEDQMTWLNRTLATSRADWIIVVGHYPVFSGGEHGTQDDLVESVAPLFEQYNVDAYFCGHDHTLQHLQRNNVQYFVTGAASKVGRYTPVPESVWGTAETSGFMAHSLQANDWTTSVIGQDGGMLYNTTQARRTKVWELEAELLQLLDVIDD